MRPAFLIPIAVLAACTAKPQPTVLSFPSDRYADAFQAAKDTLRDFEFELDRVDARSGVITTLPRAWSGAATPWLPYSSTPRDAWEGLVQFEHRSARIEFRPADPTVPPDVDLLEYKGEISSTVSVGVERVYRPGRRVDATGVRLASRASGPPAQMPGRAMVAQRPDQPLAGRILAAIAALTAVPPAAPETVGGASPIP